MTRLNKFKNLARASLVVAAVVVIVGGVTFAALQSQQNLLTGNTITTTTANLQIGRDSTNFTNTLTGYDFNNIVPGGAAMPVTGYGIYLKNGGSTPLALKLAITSAISNPNNVDLSKVNLLLTAVGSGTGMQSVTLQSLLNNGGADITGNLNPGVIQQYKLQISMASDAISGGGASLGNIDFGFSGAAVAN